jgi:carbonic anhydrase
MSSLYVRRLGKTSVVAAALVSIFAAGSAQADDWSYSGATGPAHWSGLAARYSACGNPEGQSPIKLPAGTSGTLAEISSLGTASSFTVKPEHHSVFFTPESSAGTLRHGEYVYTLKGFHYHTPSEHWDGEQATAIELHFVHETESVAEGKPGRHLVLSVLGVESTTSPAALTTVADNLGAPTLESFTPIHLIPAQRDYVSYAGSLTTPPCTADVTWVVFKNKIGIRAVDLSKFEARSHGNARPLQAKATAVVDFAGSSIRASGANVQPGAAMGYNEQYGGWRLTSAGGNFQIAFDLGSAPTADLRLVLLHLTSAKWPNNGYSPINIDVNSTPLKVNYDPARAHAGTGEDTRNYVWDRFTIPRSALRAGSNTIRFTLQPGAQTHYWIRTLRLLDRVSP